MAATQEGKHLQRLKGLYTAGRYSPNHLDQQGLCHVHHAVYRGYIQCAKWLYKHGSSLTVRSAEGSVPAHYAAAGGHLECLRWIHRKASKSISMTDNNGATPLYFAAQEGHINCLEWLAKHSGTVHWELSGDGMTAAHAAALEGHLECLAFLLRSAGCSALVRDRAANTPLHYGAACGRRHCVEWLLGNTNNVGNERNKLGSSPLHVAAQNGHLEVIKLLVRRGASIKLRDRLGRTPFNVAVDSGNEACAQFLYQAEATSMETFGSAISGTHNVKRVRFERKAIERDSDLALAHQSGHLTHSDVSAERQRVTRKSYSLYRHSAESVALLNRPSAVTVESGMDKFFQGGDSLAVKRNAFRVPQIYDSSLEDVRMKSHMTSTSLLPWSRVYKMTQFTEAVPSSPQTKIYGPYFLSDTNGRKDAPSEKYAVVESQHFVSTRFESPPSVKRSSSFLSKFVSRRKNKELFPADVDHFEDIINNSSQQSNVFKRLYKFSKEKVTKSSSFAIESVADTAKPWQRKGSIVVSGNDDFISRSTSSLNEGPDMRARKEENLPQETDQGKLSSAEIDVTDDSSKSAGRNALQHNPRKSSGGKKARKRMSATHSREMSAPRDISLIW